MAMAAAWLIVKAATDVQMEVEMTTILYSKDVIPSVITNLVVLTFKIEQLYGSATL